MSEIEGIKEGKTYRFILKTGDNLQIGLVAEYLGFSVKGGTTGHTIKFKDKDGVHVYTHNGDMVVGWEHLPESLFQQKPTTDFVPVTAAIASAMVGTEQEVSADPTIKRGRGRPRKDTPPTTTTDNATPKRRGRPPKDPSTVTTTPKVITPVDANGNVVPRKRGRPPKAVVPPPPAMQITHTATTQTTPPNIPTPQVVEEVDEIEEATEKQVVAAVAPTESTEPLVTITDEDEVIPVRQRSVPAVGVPTRPASSLARVSRVPDEEVGDL